MKRLIIIIMFLFVIGIVKAENYYVTNPANCPVTYQSQPCGVGLIVCGYSAPSTFCYDPVNILPPTSNTSGSTNYACSDATCDGGYVIDCYAYDGTAPHCDNGGNALCDRNSTCYTTYHRTTNCTPSVWVKAGCSGCLSGYTYCDGSYIDADGCEIQSGVTNCDTGANNNINSACNCVCDANYYDCDATGADAGNGCEWHVGDSCPVGGATGTKQSDCSCLVSPQDIYTGIRWDYSSSNPNATIWGQQWGLGDLLNISNSTNSSFRISQQGCIVFPNSEILCTNSTGGTNGEPLWEANYSFVVRNNTGYQNITAQMCYYINNATERSLFTADLTNTTGEIRTAVNSSLNYTFTSNNSNYVNNYPASYFCPLNSSACGTGLLNNSLSQNITSGFFVGNGSKLFDVNYSRASTVTVSASDSLDKKADVICTGTNDDVCIENAMDMLPLGGGKVVLLNGHFTLGSSIDFTASRSNITMEGMGEGTILTSSEVGGYFLTTGNLVSNVRIKSMKLIGNSAHDQYGFYIGSHTAQQLTLNFFVDSIYMQDLLYGFYATGSWCMNRAYISNSIFSNNTYGIYIGAGANYAYINNNNFLYNGYGVYLNTPQYVTVQGMSCRSCGYYDNAPGYCTGDEFCTSIGYNRTNCTDNTPPCSWFFGDGEIAEGSYGTSFCVYISGGLNNIVSNNQMQYGNGSIYITGTSNLLLTNNMMMNIPSAYPYANVKIINSYKLIVSGNNIRVTRGNGIDADSNTRDSTFNGNLLTDADELGTGQYDNLMMSGYQNVISGNRISSSAGTGTLGSRCEINMTTNSANNTVMGNIVLGVHQCQFGLSGCDINNNYCFNNINGSSAIVDTTERFEFIRDDTLQAFMDVNLFNLTSLDFAVDQAIFVDQGLKRLGIGTNAPSVALDVVGDIYSWNITATGYINSTGNINATTFYENGISLVNKYNITFNTTYDAKPANTYNATYDLKFNTTATSALNMSAYNITFNTKQGILSANNYTLFNGTCWLMQGPTARQEVC